MVHIDVVYQSRYITSSSIERYKSSALISDLLFRFEEVSD